MRRETLGVKRVASKVGRILHWTSHVSCGKGGGEGSASVVGVRCAVARLVARWWEDAFSRGGFPAATNGFPRLYISRRYVQPASLTKRHHHLQLPLHLPSIQNPVSRPLLLLPPAPAPINVQTPPPPRNYVCSARPPHYMHRPSSSQQLSTCRYARDGRAPSRPREGAVVSSQGCREDAKTTLARSNATVCKTFVYV